jgi:dTDP-4-dehydrorhamnose 3,5-epimerase
MEFREIKLRGAFLIVLKRIEDERGYFARTWCATEFAKHGLTASVSQINSGFNPHKGTLRGLHFQDPPHAEAKLVRCTRGAVWDVIVDLRPESATRGQWFGSELTADNANMMFAPEGFAHGYQTLCDNTEVTYLTSATYAPAAARGVRYNDPSFGISWPLPPRLISRADEGWPDYGL